MSLVAAYSDSESENESEEDSKESESKVCGDSNENKNDSPKQSQLNICSDTNEINNDATTYENSSTPSEEESSKHFQIEDDDDWMSSNLKNSESNNAQSNLFSALPQPKLKACEIVEEVDDEFMKKVNKYETIDKPVDKPVSTSELPNDTEKPVNRNSLILPKPSKGSSKKGTVKISIPTLDDIGVNSDSDEEESKSTRRNIPTCKKKSTLFSMLPKPKHSVAVGTNKNKMFTQQANRPLVPHTLTKKKETVTNSKAPAKKVKHNSLVGEFSDSDNDDDISGNFFSLGESTTNDKDTPPVISSASPTNTAGIKTHSSNVSLSSSSISNTSTLSSAISVSPKNTGILQKSKSNVKSNKHTASKKENVSTDTRKNNKDNSFFSSLFKSNVNATTNTNKSTLKLDSNISTLSKPKIGTNAVTTTHINTNANNTSTSKSNIASSHGNVTGPYGDVTGPYGDVTGPYGGVTGPYGGVTAPYGGVTASGSMMNYESTAKGYPTSQYANDYNTNQTSEQQCEAMNVDYSSKPNEDSVIDKDALRQLQGSKRKRENINFIDIQGPDVRGDTGKLLRHVTMEGVAQQKKKNDEDAPTSTQKKKHQIQYLAHQAKERELQLQQAWAESRASKQQTQSRYGF